MLYERRSWLRMLLCILSLPAMGIASAQSNLDVEWRGRQLDVESNFACLVDADGILRCPGNDQTSTSQWAGEHFQSVSAAEWGKCGLRSDGIARCLTPSYQAGTFPTGQWRMLSIGPDGGCGIRPDGTLSCWGSLPNFIASAPTDGPFLSVSVGAYDGCAIRLDGTLDCWNARLPGDPDMGPPPAGRFLRVAMAPLHACALRSDSRILCWGQDVDGSNAAPSGEFVDVSVGITHACGLTRQGTVMCWGSTHSSGQEMAMPSPAGTFTSLSARWDMACGRRADGIVACWGEGFPLEQLSWASSVPVSTVVMGGGESCTLDAKGGVQCFGDHPALAAPPGRYLQLSLGPTSGCGLDLSHHVRCWGQPLGPVPDVTLQSLDVGTAHACGIQIDDSLVCWGDNASGQSDAPVGQYRSVVAQDDFSCAITIAGGVKCWGADMLVAATPADEGYNALYASDTIVCVALDYHPPKCWGQLGAWYDPAPMLGHTGIAVGNTFLCWLWWTEIRCQGEDVSSLSGFPGSAYDVITAAGNEVCALDGWSRLTCRGDVPSIRPLPTVRAGTGNIAVGAAHGCNTDAFGGVDCWGDATKGQSRPPAISGALLSANADHSCGTESGNLLRCWGDDQRDGNLPPPGLAVRDLDIGQYNGCAIADGGTAVCWGWNANGQSSPPTGLFRHVATGLNHSCGVQDDGMLQCWGYGADGQTTPPVGTYLAIDVGERHSCALAADGRIRCWGLGSEGQTTPPAGDTTYRALSSGSFHNCAIRTDGTLACWGRNDRGQSSPPTGRFLSVTAGTAHACAVRDDGARVCWGSDDQGQAPSFTLTPEGLQSVEAGKEFEVAFGTTGSSGYAPRAPKFRLVAGTLPANVELTEDGLLQGHAAPQDTGYYPFTVEGRDANGFVATHDYALRIDPPPARSPPHVTGVIHGTLGNNSWYRGDIVIDWKLANNDGSSSAIATVDCETYTVTTDIAQGTASCTAYSIGGTTTATLSYRRDATPPELNATMPPPVLTIGATHDYGMSASDAMSGLAQASCLPVDTSEAGAHTATCQATDLAGNARSVSSTYTVVQPSPQTLLATLVAKPKIKPRGNRLKAKRERIRR